MNLQIKALSELKLTEKELVEQVCLQLEKDLRLSHSLHRPKACMLLYEELVRPIQMELLKLSRNQLMHICYQIDLKESESQPALMDSKLEQLTDLALNRCFQKVYLRNLLKD